MIVIAVVHGVLLAAYTIAILVGTPRGAPGPGNIMQGTDSVGYRYAAAHWPWDRDAARAAPLMPALLAMVGRNLRGFVVLQSVLWLAVWQWCAHAAARLVRNRWIALALFLVVLALSLTPEILLWTAVIGSEGLSIVLLVATMASTLTAVDRRTTKWWVITAAIVALSALGRDTNALLTAIVAVVAVVVAIRHRDRWRPAAAVVLMCTAVLGTSLLIASRAVPPRWYYPTQENILNRVVPSPTALAWFTARGMPQAEALKPIAADYFLRYSRLDTDPGFAPFRTWLRTHGQSEYTRFLLTHPVPQVRSFVRDRGYVLLPSVATYTTITRSSPGAIYGLFGAIVFWRSAGVVAAWTLLLLVVVGFSRRGWRRDDRLFRGVVALSITTGVAHAFIAYVGDYLEVGRHATTANVQLRLTLWIATLVFVDRLVEVDDGANETEERGSRHHDRGQPRGRVIDNPTVGDGV